MKTKTFLYYLIKCLNIALPAAVSLCCLFFGVIYICNLMQMSAPRLGPVSMYVVVSDSMVPVFQTNDAIFVLEVAPDTLEVGDIIAFYAFETDVTITHRIIETETTTEGYSFRTQGDNNNVADSFITPDSRLIGKYLFQIPRLNVALERIQGQPYLIVFPVMLLVLVQWAFGLLERIWKPVKKNAAAQEGEEDENTSDHTEIPVE